MVIEKKIIKDKSLTWVLRCPTKYDATELSKLRVKIDGETENLDREPGEGLLTAEDFEKLIYEDSIAEKTIFLVAEVEGKIIGFTRLEENKLNRFRHKAEFGICVLKEYWGYSIGKVLITCGKDNLASAKTMINNGAKLENEILEGNRVKQRYWITLD